MVWAPREREVTMPRQSRRNTRAPVAPTEFTGLPAARVPRSLDDTEVRAAVDDAREPSPARALTPSPQDWRDGWIYFALVDRFDNATQPPRHEPFDAPYGGFQGGTLEGVRQRLDYLQGLGVGALWLSPVLRNVPRVDGVPNEGTYHGYGIQNFLSVDPRFAQNPTHADAELRRLVDDAHERGIAVILDVVLNHTGDVFAYADAAAGDGPRAIRWRDETGRPRADWPTADAIVAPDLDAAVFPDELRRDAFFRRRGGPTPGGPDTVGDFGTLRQLLTADPAVGNALIAAHRYLIARFDIDGFRIDTLKYLDREFARTFGNAMREFALAVGKKNFFTFGEVYDDEPQIARFVGRNTADREQDVVGVDAALDFPLFFTLPGVCKGFVPPAALATMYERRKEVERHVVSSHGEATRYFVTFLDNHDQHARFHFAPAVDPHRWDHQTTLALACLFTLPGIPCVYYGTEQGLAGRGDVDHAVREALWGMPRAFDRSHPLARALHALAELRRDVAPLRYGRFYFRPISGDGERFAISSFAPGVLAFSRILHDREVVVVANTSPSELFVGDVIVDASLHAAGTRASVLYGNRPNPTPPDRVHRTGPVEIAEVDGRVSYGPASAMRVMLRPMEAQVLG